MAKIQVFLVAIFLSVFQTNLGFNLSPFPNIVIKKPNLQTFKPQNRSSYFGFSVVLREKSIIIGAPRAQSTLSSQATISEPGNIFKCPLNLKRSTTESLEIACNPFIFDPSGNILDRFQQSRNEFHDYQWLGAAMDGGINDSEPLIACAPRFDGGSRGDPNRVGFMHGICYRTANTLDENAVSVWKFKPFLVEGLQIASGVYYYQLGQLGVSAHVTPDNNEFIMGAPGFNNWQGTAVRFREDRNFDLSNAFSRHGLIYNGYAVGAGYLDDVNKDLLVYVSTAPHHDQYYGKALIYRYTRRASGTEIIATFTGTQFGEYYGYALLVSDINGDGLDDILITAPQHRINGEADIGAVYVYVNMGKFQFSQQIINAPFKTIARFGITISNLVDINHDGYKDIAIGAPLYNKVGAVVIYHGGPNGLQKEPKQILSLPENLKSSNSYFGHGLSKGVDIDGNGYTDLAIGAPNDESVYIYRAYPIVKVTTTLKANQASIKPETNFIDFEVCFQIDNEMPTALLLELVADNRLRRLRFQDNNLNQFSQTVLATNFRKCQLFKVNVIFVANQIFTPLEVELRYSLVNNGTQQTDHKFCPECVVLDPSLSRFKKSVIKYNPGCKADVCKVDLSIESMDLPKKIIIGDKKTLKVIYKIQNHGEKAFNTQVTLTNSLNLTLTRTPSQCFEFIENEVVCDIAKGVNTLDEMAFLEIEYDLKNVLTVKELLINAIVTSTGDEMNNGNNEVVVKIRFEKHSSLGIVGLPAENLLTLGEYDLKLAADYVFQLENYGPSAANTFELSLEMPMAILDETQKPMFYINASEVKYLINFGNQQISGEEFKSSSRPINKEQKNLTELWQSLETLGVNKNRTRLQMCSGSNTTLCATSILQIDSLKISEHLRLQLRIKFIAPVLRELLNGEQNVLGFFMDAAVKLNSTVGSSLNVTKSISPLVIEYRIVPERPFWIYLLAIVVGVLLFALLTFGLLKLGFFNRAKKEEMLKLLNETNAVPETAPSES